MNEIITKVCQSGASVKPELYGGKAQVETKRMEITKLHN